MMTAEFMLSKRPVLRFTAALFFLLEKFSCLFNPQAAEYKNQISQMIAWKCVAKGCGVEGQGNELQIAKSG